MSWGHVARPKDFVKKGQEIELKVIRMEPNLQPDPDQGVVGQVAQRQVQPGQGQVLILDHGKRVLGLERFEYVLHVLFQRSLELREKGAGFDAPGADRKKR